jgi:hypothetical protein
MFYFALRFCTLKSFPGHQKYIKIYLCWGQRQANKRGKNAQRKRMCEWDLVMWVNITKLKSRLYWRSLQFFRRQECDNRKSFSRFIYTRDLGLAFFTEQCNFNRKIITHDKYLLFSHVSAPLKVVFPLKTI